MKAAGGDAHDAGDGHGDVGAELHVAGRHAGLDEGVLEGEATAEEERDQIVPPHVAHVGALLDQLALPIAAVARHVRAKVGAGVGPNGLGISGDGDLVVRGSRARRQKHIPY